MPDTEHQPNNQIEANREEQIRRLTFERGQLKSKLTKFITFYDKISSVNTDKINELENRLVTILDIINKFDFIQSQLEYLNDNEESDEERDNFENKYYAVITKVKNLISTHRNEQSTSQNVSQPRLPQQNQSTSSLQNSIKLPTLELPKFQGNIDKWSQFRDLFITLVHNDNTIDNVRKFYYLTSCLVGEAQKVIASIEVTNDNYPVAWDLLISRYDNKNLTIKNHVNAILDLPVMNKTGYTLRNLCDDFQTRVRALKVLGESVDQWNSILIQILVRKLDHNTENAWEEYLITQKSMSPTLNDLIAFLSDRCVLFEKRENRYNHTKTLNNENYHSKTKQSDYHTKTDYSSYNNQTNFNKHTYPKKQSNYLKSNSHVSTFIQPCPHCKEQHKLYSCKQFLNLPVASRIPIVNKLRLCHNCLRSNHATNECISQGCKLCNKKHNTILHFENAASSNSSANISVNNENNVSAQEYNEVAHSSNAYSVSNYAINSSQQIILSTALILIKNSSGGWQTCRALLDSGSQSNFITKNLAENLGLPLSDLNVPLTGVGGTNTFTNKRIITTIKSCNSDFSSKLHLLVLPKITEFLPTYTFNKTSLQLPKDIILADESFNISSSVDVLLGAETFYSLLSSGQIKLGKNLPVLQKTVLGWVIAGPIFDNKNQARSTCHLSLINDDQRLENQLEKFWAIEDYTGKKHLSDEESNCEEIFNTTVSKDTNNHFIVNLPIKNNIVNLGDSLQNAVKRLYAMERKFTKNSEFKDQYVKFMSEYEELGHMSCISKPFSTDLTKNIFYLPHHGVIKQSSLTTKLRVVFDGSCKSSNGVSLNDILMVGPTLQEDLFDILIRFRKHNYVLTGDIAKMYRQVNITESQRDLQRIVWRADSSQPIKHYRLNTVTYGTSAASFLAVRCLQQVAIENKHLHPNVCQIIMEDFYVDDLITGSESMEGAIEIKSEIFNILKQSGFELRKWVSNDPRIIQKTNLDVHDKYEVLCQETSKTLGLSWQAGRDILKYTVNTQDSINSNISKRTILSSISKLFDPLGLVSPIIIRAKILIQQLWLSKLAWDDPLPPEIKTSWLNFKEQLSEINHIRIPRQVVLKAMSYTELHCFCDASLSSFGACIYVKSIHSNGAVLIRLLCAKTRVAPIKTVTLPRLELCGAVLSAQLYQRVSNSLKMNIDSVHFWTDSTIVLAWLSSPPSTWKIFVSNRVAEILRISTRQQWRHVPSKSNPADILSRGTTATELKTNTLWWNGPPWLSCDIKFWPNQPITANEIPERRLNLAAHISQTNNSIFFRYSTLYKLKRVVALCFRFLNNSRKGAQKTYGELTLEELKNAMTALLRIAQLESFPLEIHSFQRAKSLPRESRLLTLNPFVDSDGLIRVGGRLLRANIVYDKKFPIVIHPKHPLTKLIILDEHHKKLHAGTQTILASLRQQYWPLNGQITVKNIVRKCVTCFRLKPTTLIQKMSDLPIDRITPNQPFFITGVDVAGPFFIKDGKLRNRKIIKAYLCLFICFTTRAVHLEPISDMTSVTFLNALKRFTSRRGLCKTIYSDNGLNFVGANNELRDIVETLKNFVTNKAFSEFFMENQICWKFIPAYSPHHGGLWEAGIKQAKIHILKVLKNIHPTFEELATIFSQVEAILNSRPITPLSNDPNDFGALTPGHFLIGRSLLSIPQHDHSKLPTNRLNQYKALEQASQHFWSRWSREYLSLLQNRNKWTNSAQMSLTPGSMVLLVDKDLPPLKWKLGRVEELHPGQDGQIRVVTVRTPTGTTTRAIQKLCLLPCQQ